MRELRTRLSLTQSQVAKAMHVDRTTVSKWESKQARPQLELLIPLAHLYLVSVEKLIEVLTES